jgi:hypothetical protein
VRGRERKNIVKRGRVNISREREREREREERCNEGVRVKERIQFSFSRLSSQPSAEFFLLSGRV